MTDEPTDESTRQERRDDEADAGTDEQLYIPPRRSREDDNADEIVLPSTSESHAASTQADSEKTAIVAPIVTQDVDQARSVVIPPANFFQKALFALRFLNYRNWLSAQMQHKMLRWVLFRLLIALTPLLFDYLRGAYRSAGMSLTTVIEKGELLLVATGMCAGALGELFGSGRAALKGKLFAAFGCMFVLIFNCLCYADIRAAWLSDEPVKAEVVLTISFVFYSVAFLSSTCCLILSEWGGVSEG